MVTPTCVSWAPPGADDPRQAEVGHLHLAAAAEHQVFGLDVAVDDAPLLRLVQGGGRLAQDVEHQPRFQTALFAHHLAQVVAGHVLLGDEVGAAGAAHLVHLDDVGVNQRGGGSGLVLEAADVGGVAREVGAENLQRHLPAERLLFGQVDLGHRPPPNPAEHLIVAELLAGVIWHDGRSIGGKSIACVFARRSMTQ